MRAIVVRSDDKRTKAMPQIVLVEDDLTLRNAYAMLLESQGYVVHQFGDYMG